MTNANNCVSITGRLSQAGQIRALPSGDIVATFRVVVDRRAAVLKRSKQRVDTFECSAWTAKLRRRVASLNAGDVVTVTGELRRRFARVQGAPASFVSIDADTVRKIRPAA